MPIVTDFDAREERIAIETLAPHYPQGHWVHYLIFANGGRPAVSLSHGGERDEVIKQLQERSPYCTFRVPRLGDTIFARMRPQIEAAGELEDRADVMDVEEYHRTCGRALGYPTDAVEFFVEHLETAVPNAVEMDVIANDLLREGSIDYFEWRSLDLIPYVVPGDRESVLRAVRQGAAWAEQLPPRLGYGPMEQLGVADV